MRKRKILAALTTASALAISVLATPPAAQASATTRKAIPNTKPAWTRTAAHLGHAADRAKVTARVYLAPRGGMAALQREAVAVSTPGTASYRHFLTTNQYYAAFEPSSASVSHVSAWLTASGLTMKGVAAHHRYLTITGTVKQAEKAFGTQIEKYRKDGKTVQAPASALSAPAGVAPLVLAVTGVDAAPSTVAPASTPKDAPPSTGFRNARPCSLYYGQLSAKFKADFKTPLPKFDGATLPYSICGYTGPQVRSAYEGPTTLDGTGVTVAITDAYASATIEQDAKRYAAAHGDGPYAPGQFSQRQDRPFSAGDPDNCDASGWYGEETLDVEAVHAMAPGANIRYYGAATCNDSDFIFALQQVVDEDVAQLVSNSWGDVEAKVTVENVNAYEAVFLQGATEGISFTFSSGDDGDEAAASGTKQADYPVSDPFVTAVGGTSSAINKEGKLAWQTGWGTEKDTLSADGTAWSSVGFTSGAGGGESSLFDQPDYQNGITPAGGRMVPDVALIADPTTGFLVGQTQTFPEGVSYGEYRIGGTSVASPLFAGMTALSLQHAGHSVGMLNVTIYANARTGAFTDVRGRPKDVGNVRADYANNTNAHDGLLYSVREFNEDSSLKVDKGWDNVTGLGTPNAKWLTSVH